MVFQFVWGLSSSLVVRHQLPSHLVLQHSSISRGDRIGKRRSTSIRPIFASNNDDNDETPQDSPQIDISAISDKISWIFDEGDFLDDEDDSFFDDLFLTDDEDDGYNDGGGFIQDDNDEDGPDASLNEDDLMMLYDMSPAPSSKTKASVATNQTSTSSEGSILPTTTTSTDQTAQQTNLPTTVSLDNILASLESDLSYFYLRDELGISEDVMWKITNDAPSVLGLKAKNVRNKVHVLQSLVGFSDEEIRRLITSQPTLLQLSVKKNLSPSILYWIRQLQIGKDELKTLILGCPALLKYSRANVQGKLMFFQSIMGFSLQECRKLLVSEPRLLTSSVKTGLIPRLEFLNKEIELSLPEIRKMVQKNPRILLMSVEQNLTPKCVFYFIMTLQMNTKDVGKLLIKYPQILDYNLEHHITPIHHYFLSLDFSSYEFSRIIQRYPRLVTYSLIHIKRRIGYLRFGLYFQADAIRRILYQCPQIVSLGQENLETTVDFLLQTVAPGTSLVPSNSVEGSNDGPDSSELVETDDKDALSILQILIAGLPTLLTLSIEKNLQPKVDYLRDRLGQEELSSALLRMPALLGYSLDKRIEPRLEAMLKAKIPPGKITQAITQTQDNFEEWLERQIRNQANGGGRRTLAPKQVANTGAAKTAAEIDSATMTLADPIIDQLETTTTNETNSASQDPPKSTEDEDGDADMDEGNSRVVEEGGKIIHWRRRR